MEVVPSLPPERNRMLKAHKFGTGFLALALIAGFGSYIVGQVKPTMSAGAGPVDVTWSGILGYIASGSAVATAAAFWKNNQPAFTAAGNQISTYLNHSTPITPAPGKSEAVDATIAYYANKTDINARTRFVNASLAELRDVVGKDNPQLMTQLNALAVAYASSQFPVQPSQNLAVSYPSTVLK